MIKQIAIAIGGLDNDRCNPCTAEKIVKCKDCLDAAKRAIVVMREPTQNMLVKADNIIPDNVDSEEIWKTMIDEALKG